MFWRSRTGFVVQLFAVLSLLELAYNVSSRAVGPGRPGQGYGPPGTSNANTAGGSPGTTTTQGPPVSVAQDKGSPGGVDRSAGPPGGQGSQIQAPPGYPEKLTDSALEDDPFDEPAPPGWKGKETFPPGPKDTGPPAHNYHGAPGEDTGGSAELNRLPEGPPSNGGPTRLQGPAGPPSAHANPYYYGSPGSSPLAGSPGSNHEEEFAPPGTAPEKKRDVGAPGPNTGQSNHRAAQYYRQPKRPLGIREPDSNLTIDQIITKVMGGPEAIRFSSLIGENSTILAELDMRLTIDQYLNLYEHTGDSHHSDGRRVKRKAVAQASLRWLNQVIPYEFIYSDFNEQEVAMIKASMDEWQESTCLKFVPARPWHFNRIRFQQGHGCSSQVGMVGGTQAIYLDSGGCRWRGLYLHEIAHSIGLVHEHQRPDRDLYIYIQWDKVDPTMKEWFRKYDRSQVNPYGVQYDLQSVMHYGVTAFSRDGKTTTIKVLDPTMQNKVGLVRFKELVHSDKEVVNLMYKCSEKCPSNIRCTSEGYLDKNCRCVCKNPNNQCYESGQAPTTEEEDETCEDEFEGKECKRWANYGECYLNPTWMSLNCMKSCGKCGKKANETAVDDGCNDSNTKCTEWAKRGECSKNQFWMYHHCPKACGRCGQEECKNIYDDDKMCEFWASSGECDSNTAWMVEKCRKACDRCPAKGECVNLHYNDTLCRRWAGNGECKTNPNWMGEQCRKSCGLCEESVKNSSSVSCNNAAENDKCVEWAAKGECTANAAWMMRNCKKTCTKCQFIDEEDEDQCVNTFIDDDQCDSWARSGECDRNAHWMRDLCTKSCKKCKKHLESDCINFYIDEEKCEDWVRQGECLQNAVWMAANCNRSCSKCKELRPCMNYFTDTKQCDDWAKIGECYANREWMIDNCYVACTDCDGGNRTRGRACINRDEDDEKCDLWADLRECKFNRDWMMARCYRSCTECDGISRESLFPCENKFKDDVICEKWAQLGQCSSNRIWMLKNCRKACKRCDIASNTTTAATVTPSITTTTTTAGTTLPPISADCQDVYYDKRMCRVWAAGKQCTLNPSWMLINCKKSCGRCRSYVPTTTEPPVVVIVPEEGGGEGSGSDEKEEVDSGPVNPTCRDENPGCNGWASHGQCLSNPGFMFLQCKRSCGMCDPAKCVDKNPLCSTWAGTNSYCHVNHRYMMPNCPKSCGVC